MNVVWMIDQLFSMQPIINLLPNHSTGALQDIAEHLVNNKSDDSPTVDSMCNKYVQFITTQQEKNAQKNSPTAIDAYHDFPTNDVEIDKNSFKRTKL